MIIKGLRDEDFLQYKLPSMFIAFPSCTFKCEKECNCKGMCQNSTLAKAPSIELSAKDIIDRYNTNPISKALVLGGLEPFDSFQAVLELLAEYRKVTNEPFIIYTGYRKDEIKSMTYCTHWSHGKVEYSYLEQLMHYPNIILKFGRYVPNQTPHYDEVLGVELASDNQYAEKIS